MAPNPSSGSTFCKQAELEESLEQLDIYARAQAHKMIPRTTLHPDTLDLEIDDLAQEALVAWWMATRKVPIGNDKSYLKRAMRNRLIDMVRQYKRHPVVQLSFDEDGELSQGAVLNVHNDSAQDLSDDLVDKESLFEHIEVVIARIAELAPRQQEAMLCTLKDELDEAVALLKEVCGKYALDIEKYKWPDDKKEIQSLKASRSVARKKLRISMLDQTASVLPPE